MSKHLSLPRYVYAVALAGALQFVLPNLVVHLQNSSAGCEVVPFEKLGAEDCRAGRTCRQKYILSLVSGKSVVSLGNVFRDFRVIGLKRENELKSKLVSSATPESWSSSPTIYVERDSSELTIELNYPKASFLRGVVGLRPRLCTTDTVKANAEHSRTISGILNFLLIFLLISGLILSKFSGRVVSGEPVWSKTGYSIAIVTSALMIALIGRRFFDSFFLDRVTNLVMIRGVILSSLFLLIFGFLDISKSRIKSALVWYIPVFGFMSSIITNDSINPTSLPLYPIVFSLLVSILSIQVILKWKWFDVVLVIPLVLDSLRMTGVFYLDDFLPQYFYMISIFGFGMRSLSHQGLDDVVQDLSAAFASLKRQVFIHKFEREIGKITPELLDEGSRFEVFRSILGTIGQIVGAKRVSMVVSIPGYTAVTLQYDQRNDSFNVYDDGEIRGRLFARMLLYNEELMFEKFSEIQKKDELNLKQKSDLEDHDYFCLIPMLSGGDSLGGFSLTGFEDSEIEKLKKSGEIDYVVDLIELISMRVVTTLEKVSHISKSSQLEQLRLLQAKIDIAYGSSRAHSDFFRSLCREIASSYQCKALVFRQNGSTASVIATKGLTSFETEEWCKNDLQIKKHLNNRVGPFIVAFLEGKTSFVRDVEEISPLLHERSVQLFRMSGVKSLFVSPLVEGTERYVIALMFDENARPAALGLTNTFPKIVPYVSVMDRSLENRSLNETLGSIVTRFVGDDNLREDIITSFSSDNANHTVGKTRSSLIIINDIVGSKDLKSMSDEERAVKLGRFYNRCQDATERLVGGFPRKASGDSLAFTVDLGTSEEIAEVRGKLEELFREYEEAARDIGCLGVRIAVGYGSYFCGLIGTNSFSQVDVLGTSIDHVFTLESVMKDYKNTEFEHKVAMLEHAYRVLFGDDLMAASYTHELLGKIFAFRNFDDLSKERGALSIETKVAS